MRILLFMLLCSVVSAAERSSYTRPFGAGTLTTRSDGSVTTTRKFGTGHLSETRFRSGPYRYKSSISTKFGNGYITRERWTR
jgi:hypothetical protein